jgi:hypothetical protein|tara:strand:+ start:545 stop:1411 length:867 start_codon:yes stop_codon:yes gene_type:complete
VDPPYYPLGGTDPPPPVGLNQSDYDYFQTDSRFYDDRVGVGNANANGLTFKENGQCMYVIAKTKVSDRDINTGEPASYETRIYQYNLSTAWDISTWDTTNVVSYTFSGSRNFGLSNPKWSPDGRTLYVNKNDNNPGSCWPDPPTCGVDSGIVKYTTPVPWKLSTLTEIGYIPSVPQFAYRGQMDLYDFTENGTSIFAMGKILNVDGVWKTVINLNTPYDLMTMETDIDGNVMWVPNSEINLTDKVAEQIVLSAGQLRPSKGIFIQFNEPTPTYWAMFNLSTLVKITEI